MADEKNIETVVLNEQEKEAETVVLDEALVKEIVKDESKTQDEGEASSRVVRLDSDLKDTAGNPPEDAS